MNPRPYIKFSAIWWFFGILGTAVYVVLLTERSLGSAVFDPGLWIAVGVFWLINVVIFYRADRQGWLHEAW